MAVLFVSVLALASVATNAFRPATPAADAADGRTFEMTTPLPGRGYWLPGDDTISFAVECLDGERRQSSSSEGFSDGGWTDNKGFGHGVADWAAEGTYEIVIDCVLEGDSSTVKDSKTFTIEIGAATHLVATVGTVPGECATTPEITVEAGTEVFWCYTLQSNPELDDGYDPFWEFSAENDDHTIDHTVVDVLNGTLGTVNENDPSGPLDVGISSVMLGLSSSTVATDSVTNTGTWSSLMIRTEHQDPWERSLPDRSASAQVIVADAESSNTTVPGTSNTTVPDTAGTGTTAPPTATPASPVASQPAYTG